jgi:hypothetical protein
MVRGEGYIGRGEGVSLEGATVDVDVGGGAVGGDIVGGGYTVELFAGVYKGGRHTKLAHVFEHDAMVCGIEGSREVRVHDIDVFVVNFGMI